MDPRRPLAAPVLQPPAPPNSLNLIPAVLVFDFRGNSVRGLDYEINGTKHYRNEPESAFYL